jgi:hypothetical protein
VLGRLQTASERRFYFRGCRVTNLILHLYHTFAQHSEYANLLTLVKVFTRHRAAVDCLCSLGQYYVVNVLNALSICYAAVVSHVVCLLHLFVRNIGYVRFSIERGSPRGHAAVEQFSIIVG